jgi:hypothetical protein
VNLRETGEQRLARMDDQGIDVLSLSSPTGQKGVSSQLDTPPAGAA